MHQGVFTSLLIGAGVAHFGITGSGEPPVESPPAVVAEKPDEGNPAAAPLSPEQYAQLALERMVTPAKNGGAPPPGYIAPRPEMAADIQSGIVHLDSGVRKLPGYAVQMASQIEKHGIAAMAYTDPEMKRTGNAIGQEIGTGIRNFAQALGKDLVASAAESQR